MVAERLFQEKVPKNLDFHFHAAGQTCFARRMKTGNPRRFSAFPETGPSWNWSYSCAFVCIRGSELSFLMLDVKPHVHAAGAVVAIGNAIMTVDSLRGLLLIVPIA